jgi:WD40 repeat protein
VAIANNGAIVAGSNYTDNFVQVFQLVGTQWEQLGNTITEGMAIFGNCEALALSSDGLTLAVGDYAGGNSSVKVFHLDGNTWNQLGQTIVALEPEDGFGFSVSLSGDGKIVAGGAWAYDVGGTNIGNARVFGLNDQNQWDQMGSTLVGDAAYDYFGSSVALSSNGLTLAVGANGYDGAAGSATGLVRVFQFDNNDWQQVGQDLEGMAADDYFGSSVAISADGTTVAGGTYDTPGYVQVFYHESNDE